ncbi:MAG: hypothetical protein MUP82_07075 [Candidatus Marinimicrobia bacterium]|nr:hypothetical protein [Candidatus Neomarinimicrobiota bacterium]
MKIKTTIIFLFSAIISNFGLGQDKTSSYPLQSIGNLLPINTSIESVQYLGKAAVKVTELDPSAYYEDTFVRVKDINFKNGTIEVLLLGKLSNNAISQARGFVGIAFHINGDNSKFDCIYIRPTNSRSDEQLRRNHTVQYISHPEYPWYKLREESPGKYEAYVDIDKDNWTKIKIVIKDKNANLFFNDAEQPTLIVNDLKQNLTEKGSIGLWIGPGSVAYFSNLTIINDD